MIVTRSSESVGRGHPDKMADWISDAILDALVHELGNEIIRYAGEVLVGHGKVMVAGEGTTWKQVDFHKITNKILDELGYDSTQFEFIQDYVPQASPLEQLNPGKCRVASDQSVIFGFATSFHPEYLPLEYLLSKKLTLKTKELIDNKTLWWAQEDYKVLVNLELDIEDLAGKWEFQGARLSSIVFSIQHDPGFPLEEVRKEVQDKVILPVLKELNISWDNKTSFLINPAGVFALGGLFADTGSTNRKPIADAYGPFVHHGGGGLNGKDLTKIDKLGAYYARWVCKNIVAAGLAKELEIRLTYSIAKEEAISCDIAYSLGSVLDADKLNALIKACFPTKILDIYEYMISEDFSFVQLSTVSHFGNFVPNLPWEKLNKVKEIDAWIKQT
ncbi:S-adenosylmethionine synthetase [Candidatus Mycoplasma haematolamae str. Purdue]|uniref:S-adenosylmethionine synthetase n=1 Tax=Mycoplasma haematolamae (strain Purdue) TaxID=1212765 RepID=I7BII0_MYCHA|nr:methionine adenosyltransferase [Candidatus Mycoplasma haematolamae]AFO51628.1 S-adenosylmethionine synthetase [Candidatus Mycoplasma haematolamae str. Purdue]